MSGSGLVAKHTSVSVHRVGESTLRNRNMGQTDTHTHYKAPSEQASREGGWEHRLTILVVVTHLGLVLGGRNAGRLNGLFGNLYGLLVHLRAGALRLGVDGVFVDVRVGVVGVGGRVVGVSRQRAMLDSDLFAVVRGRVEAFAVLAFDGIKRVYQVLVVTGVDLHTSVVELLSLEVGEGAGEEGKKREISRMFGWDGWV